MNKFLKWLIIILPLIVVLFVLLLVEIIPSNVEEEKEIKNTEFKTKDNRVTFTASEEFKQEEKGQYDLYLNKDEKQIMGVFTYTLSDYEENSSKEILDKQINYFVSSRKDMKVYKKETKIEDDEKTITRVEYSGKTEDSSDCVYIFSVIDFKNDTNYVVYVNQVIIKDSYEEKIKEMIDILKSAKLNKLIKFALKISMQVV